MAKPSARKARYRCSQTVLSTWKPLNDLPYGTSHVSDFTFRSLLVDGQHNSMIKNVLSIGADSRSIEILITPCRIWAAKGEVGITICGTVIENSRTKVNGTEGYVEMLD